MWRSLAARERARNPFAMNRDDAEEIESEMARHHAVLFSAGRGGPEKPRNARMAKASDLAFGEHREPSL